MECRAERGIIKSRQCSGIRWGKKGLVSEHEVASLTFGAEWTVAGSNGPWSRHPTSNTSQTLGPGGMTENHHLLRSAHSAH